jgi:hypothetical protein
MKKRRRTWAREGEGGRRVKNEKNKEKTKKK